MLCREKRDMGFVKDLPDIHQQNIIVRHMWSIIDHNDYDDFLHKKWILDIITLCCDLDPRCALITDREKLHYRSFFIDLLQQSQKRVGLCNIRFSQIIAVFRKLMDYPLLQHLSNHDVLKLICNIEPTTKRRYLVSWKEEQIHVKKFTAQVESTLTMRSFNIAMIPFLRTKSPHLDKIILKFL